MRTLPSPAVTTPLLAWLLQTLSPMNRTRVKKLLASGQVHLNGTSITQHDTPVSLHDRITLQEPHTAQSLAILHDDAALVAIDKPAGLLSVASDAEKADTAFMRLSKTMPARPVVVHRLDRETSGVLLFAKSQSIRDALQAAWDGVEKTYLAVVEGTPKQMSGTIEGYLLESRSLKVSTSPRERPGSKYAITHYRVLRPGPTSLIELTIPTGRKHQIRVHLASIGTPILGDVLYGARPAARVALHAQRVRLPHPLTGTMLEILAPAPAMFS